MDAPILSSELFKKVLQQVSQKLLHEFDGGTMHKIALSSEEESLQKKFIDYNVEQDVASREELEIYFDETSTSDLEFIETNLPDDVSIDRIIVCEAGGSILSLYLMSLEELNWTFYTVDGMEFFDVLFKGGNQDDITSTIIWLYLTDRKPNGYHKVTNFLSPHPENIGSYELQLSQLLDKELTHQLIAESPISPSFSL